MGMFCFLRFISTAGSRRRAPNESNAVYVGMKIASSDDQRPYNRLSGCRVKAATHECRLETRTMPLMTVVEIMLVPELIMPDIRVDTLQGIFIDIASSSNQNLKDASLKLTRGPSAARPHGYRVFLVVLLATSCQ